MTGETGEYYDRTTLHPAGLAVVLLMGIAVLMLPRRYAVLPMFVVACFVSPAQRLVLFGLDFNFLRIMVLFGWIRVINRGEFRAWKIMAIDWVILAYALVRLMAYVAQKSSFAALEFQLGQSFDTIGMFFLFRFLVRDWAELFVTVKCVVLLSIPVLVCFAIERGTGRNLFSALGGVPEFTPIRQGRLRCQGAFSHPIMAGCFWAALLPLIAARWWSRAKGSREMTLLGLAAASAVILLCASSTPVMAVLFGVLGAMLFRVRFWMRWVRWGFLAMVVVLHLLMQKPVWHLISRVNVVSGSTGWHRYYLIDQAVNHFGEWALFGIGSTRHWGRGLQDITNQYIMEGVRGGALTLALFVALLVLSFRSVGRLWRAYARNKARLMMSWALGCSLFLQVATFFSVSYFGQVIVVWYFLLAVIASLEERLRAERRAAALVRRRRLAAAAAPAVEQPSASS